MKFGKIEDISKVDFTLPEDPLENNAVFDTLTIGDPELFIGCTGWGMKEWKGSYYPEKTKAENFLFEYGKQFNSIELNSTHYGTPKHETLEKWYGDTPSDFKFCPKLHKAISHRKTLGTDSDIIENTVNALSTLNEKLGPIFMQLPPYFDSSRLSSLVHFFEVFPSEFDLSIELRHPSWFEDKSRTDELHHMALEYNKSLLITDVAGRRDILHMRVCGDYLMIRFVGNGLHPTDFSRVDEWILRIQSYIAKGLKKIYFFPHEPDNILAPQLAEYLCNKFTSSIEIKTRGPKKIDRPKQLNLF
ncbi:MAG: DUF72 domain-containing protein [Saprospiraceae bacterium]|nr:DUF72 domain-containing protein [Saprospiraceae bacterium]